MEADGIYYFFKLWLRLILLRTLGNYNWFVKVHTLGFYDVHSWRDAECRCVWAFVHFVVLLSNQTTSNEESHGKGNSFVCFSFIFLKST